MAGTSYTLYRSCNNGGCGSSNAVCNATNVPAAPRCSCVNLATSVSNVASGIGYPFGSDQIRLFDGADCSVGYVLTPAPDSSGAAHYMAQR